MSMKIDVKSLVFTAVYAALCCVATMIIIVPLPNGYVNAGDVLVLLAGWCLGPYFGGISAGVGCAIADLVSGYVIYAPVTFVVKFVVAILAFYIARLFKKIIKKDSLDFVSRVISAIIAELFMVLGYFIYESILYGLVGGSLALVGNTLQGTFCAIGGTLLISVLYRIKYIRNVFPRLNSGEK